DLSVLGDRQMPNPMLCHLLTRLVSRARNLNRKQRAAHDGTDQRLLCRTGFGHPLTNQVRFADDTTVVTGLMHQQCADLRVTHQLGRLQQRCVWTDCAQGPAHHHGERSLKRSALNRHTTRSVRWREQIVPSRCMPVNERPRQLLPAIWLSITSLLTPGTVAILDQVVLGHRRRESHAYQCDWNRLCRVSNRSLLFGVRRQRDLYGYRRQTDRQA